MKQFFYMVLKNIYNNNKKIKEKIMEGKTHGKDIMLLCKGWYDNEKYKTLKDALIEYYHKNYGCS